MQNIVIKIIQYKIIPYDISVVNNLSQPSGTEEILRLIWLWKKRGSLRDFLNGFLWCGDEPKKVIYLLLSP